MNEVEQHEEELVEEKNKKSFLFFWLPTLLGFTAALVIFLTGFISYLNTAPETFSTGTVVSIETGESVRDITKKLEEASVVRSATFLYFVIVLFHEPENIKASTYVFEEPISTYSVAERLTLGDFDTDLLRFTHIEGERATVLAERASVVLPNFDKETFLAIAEPNEGRLFPDTYFVPESYTAEELAELMLETFDNSIAPYSEQILAHSLTLEEIIVLASIIEREANSPSSMKMVSSVLQNRLEIDMPLQADASIEYVLDKPLEELTPEDLEIDSPYNTYLNLGLPPTPIGNPGLTSILAVLEPEKTDYFYYITDDTGVFHFARTYREHQKNINLYLR